MVKEEDSGRLDKMNNLQTCPYCQQSRKQWKAGKGSLSGNQRYRCGHCLRRYTPTPSEGGHGQTIRRKAVEMYMDGGTYRQVGRALGVHHTSVMNWVRDQALQTPVNAPVPAHASVIEMDELFTAKAPKRDKKTRATSSR